MCEYLRRGEEPPAKGADLLLHPLAEARLRQGNLLDRIFNFVTLEFSTASFAVTAAALIYASEETARAAVVLAPTLEPIAIAELGIGAVGFAGLAAFSAGSAIRTYQRLRRHYS